MGTINKLQKSKMMFYIVCGGIFAIMLVSNILTPLCADDYAYTLSWATKDRITNFFQIFDSMSAHREIMNGRSISHFLVQTFLLLPPIVFKLLNASMFVIQVLLIYIICKGSKEHNNYCLITIFCLIWIFEPAFGQVNLWLDGACNYLWSAVFGLLYLLMLTNELNGNGEKLDIRKKIILVILGFVIGGYLENISAAVIFMNVCILLLITFYKKRKIQVTYFIAFCASVISFILMATAPGEVKNKFHSGGLSFYRQNLITTMETFKLFWILLAVFVVLFIISLSVKVNKDRIIISSLFVLGSLCSNFIFIVASYYPERSAFASVIFLVVADCMLLYDVFETKHNILFLSSVSILMIVTLYFGVIGINDIYVTNGEMKANTRYIEDCKMSGVTDIDIPMIKASTKYSAVYGLKYLDSSDRTSWPNDSMAIYFGVNSIGAK